MSQISSFQAARWAIVVILATFALVIGAGARSAGAAHPIWVAAYYAVWQQKSALPPDKIDYTAFSHLIHFAIIPTATGEIDQSRDDSITRAMSDEVIARAHAAGDKVIVSVGGDGAGTVCASAISGPVRAKFIRSLVEFVRTRGYDGVDIDIEPLAARDYSNYKAFVHGLRAALKHLGPDRMMTVAATTEPAQAKLLAELKSEFDQINIMTYDLSGPWDGFKTWYNSSLYGSGSEMMVADVPYPSVTGAVATYIAAGVPTSKLGMAMAFYGDVWTGVAGPRQSITGVTNAQIPYNAIMDQYYSPAAYHWDAIAHAPYLGIASDSPDKSKFVSYDDARLCAEKVMYARRHGLGGVTIFELGDGYQPNAPEGSRDMLLQSVKKAWHQPLH